MVPPHQTGGQGLEFVSVLLRFSEYAGTHVCMCACLSTCVCGSMCEYVCVCVRVLWVHVQVYTNVGAGVDVWHLPHLHVP